MIKVFYVFQKYVGWTSRRYTTSRTVHSRCLNWCTDIYTNFMLVTACSFLQRPARISEMKFIISDLIVILSAFFTLFSWLVFLSLSATDNGRTNQDVRKVPVLNRNFCQRNHYNCKTSHLSSGYHATVTKPAKCPIIKVIVIIIIILSILGSHSKKFRNGCRFDAAQRTHKTQDNTKMLVGIPHQNTKK